MNARTAFGIVALAAAVSAPAAAAAGWTQPIAITPAPVAATTAAHNARLAVSAGGDQVLAWEDWEVTGDQDLCRSGEATTRVPGGDWTTPIKTGCGSQVQITPDGTALAVWETIASGTHTLEVATAPPGAGFGAAQPVDAESEQHFDPAVALGPGSRVTAAWFEYDDATSSTDLIAKTQAADGTWPAARETVKANAAVYTPGFTLAIGPSGDAVVAWAYQSAFGNTGGVSVATRAPPPASTWTETPLFAETAGASPATPVLAFDGQDRATVLDALTLSGGAYELDAWSRAAYPAAWDSTAQVVPSTDSSAAAPLAGLALDSSGNAQAAFLFATSSGGDPSYSVRASTRSAGSNVWSAPPDELGSTTCLQSPGPPAVSFDAVDTATISFNCDGSHVFTRAAGATTYGAAPDGPAGSVDPEIVTDPDGYLIATWTGGDGITYTSVYDAVAPTIDSVTPPAGAVAGQPAVFQVAGSDAWGPVTFTVDFGDGSPVAHGRVLARTRFGGPAWARASVSNSVSHAYDAAGAYTATITMLDSGANSTSSTRALNVDAAPSALPGIVPLPPVPGLPDPIAGQTVNIALVKPPVRVKVPGAKRFVPLTVPTQVRVGALIDTTKGRVRITIDNGHGGFDTADFYEGLFRITQRKATTALASLLLSGGNFKGCPRAPKVHIARRRLSPKRSVRHLWGSGNGAFQTVGRFSSAAIRGTTWLTDDRCPGTLTRVTAGKVAVRDFVRHERIIVRKGKSYLAKPRAKRAGH